MKSEKVGVLTVSFGLMIIGIMIILHIGDIVTLKAFQFIGPILLIMLGAEILWRISRHRQSETGTRLRISGWSSILLVLILLFNAAQFILPSEWWQPKYMTAVEGKVPIDSTIKEVYIELPDGKINVTGTDESFVSFNGQLAIPAWSKDEAEQSLQSNWKVHSSGDRLEIILDIPHFNYSFLGFNLIDQPPYLSVEVPRHLFAKLYTRNGKIVVQNMDAGVDGKTSNGAVVITHIKGNVKSVTSNGSQKIENIEGAADIHTSNGSISLIDISGSVTAKTSNGAIHGESAINGNWECKTSNGAIHMDLWKSPDVKIEAKTSNGSVGGDVEWMKDSNNVHVGTLGSGVNRMELTTSNGKIQVKKSN